MSDDAARPDAPALRASDAEREAAADALRRHATAGRLEPDELDERLGGAYGARTTDDLAALVADLPALADPTAATRPADHAARVELRAHLLQRGGGGLAIVLVCVAVWVATGAEGHPWPVWVLLGAGVGVGGTWWRGLGPGGDPVRELERERVRQDRRRYVDPHRKRGGPHF